MLLNQHLIALGLFHGIQIFALEVLDQTQLHDLAVIRLNDYGGDFVKTGGLGGTPTAFAGDDLVVAGRQLAYGDGLNNAELTNRIGQLRQGLIVELCSWLCGVGNDFVYGNLGHLVHGRCLYRRLVGAENGI